MASLLVSVRSASEALAALEGGAAVIDVKEPDRGPLGRADASVWSEVRAAVPYGTPVSVALGELTEWVDGRPQAERGRLRGFAFRKVGLAGAGPHARIVVARMTADGVACAIAAEPESAP